MRRRLAMSSLLALSLPSSHAADGDGESGFASSMQTIEQSSGGRLGVSVRRLGHDQVLSYRGRELFPMCSTFKLLAAALVLRRVDRGEEFLTRLVSFGRADLVANSPLTSAHVDDGVMSIGDLCAAAITRSDNTAGNLLLRSFGGPDDLTGFARALGDRSTRLDRIEPLLNEAAPGDPRDTTSPLDMNNTIDRVLGRDVLSPGGRSQLLRWLLANETGDRRLRAFLPAGWTVGDKTGTGEHGTANDVGLLYPPDGASPLVVCCYLTGGSSSPKLQDATIALVGLRCASLDQELEPRGSRASRPL